MPLGRGLASLIPPKGDEPKKNNRENDRSDSGTMDLEKRSLDPVFLIEVEKIHPNPMQPRRTFEEEALKELAASIREYGVIQPLIVSKIERETNTGTSVEYQLIAGERRLMASKLAGLERVPAIIRRVSEEIENLELAIIENLQRSDLNPIETARAYARLQDEFRLTQREVAVKMGKSREAVANSLRLLNLPSDIQSAIESGKVNESHARLLLSIPDPALQRKLLAEILEKSLSVRDLKVKIPDKTDRSSSAKADPTLSYWEEELSGFFGTKVKIEKTKKGGKIVINFFSPEEMQGIFGKIKPED